MRENGVGSGSTEVAPQRGWISGKIVREAVLDCDEERGFLVFRAAESSAPRSLLPLKKVEDDAEEEGEYKPREPSVEAVSRVWEEGRAERWVTGDLWPRRRRGTGAG